MIPAFVIISEKNINSTILSGKVYFSISSMLGAKEPISCSGVSTAPRAENVTLSQTVPTVRAVIDVHALCSAFSAERCCRRYDSAAGRTFILLGEFLQFLFGRCPFARNAGKFPLFSARDHSFREADDQQHDTGAQRNDPGNDPCKTRIRFPSEKFIKSRFRAVVYKNRGLLTRRQKMQELLRQ